MAVASRQLMPPGLADLLAGYRADALRRMAGSAMSPRPHATKVELIDMLAEHMSDPQWAATALDSLDPAARQVFDRIRLIGRPVDWQTLSTHLVADGTVGAPETFGRHRHSREEPRKGKPGAVGSTVFQDVLARIELRGLILGTGSLERSSSVVDFGVAHVYRVPPEIAHHLPKPPPLGPFEPAWPAEAVLGDPAAYSRELYLIWSFIWSRRPTLLRAGTLSKADLRALAGRLPYRLDVAKARSEVDLPRILVGRMMLKALSLVVDGPQLDVDLDAARRFWGEPLSARLLRCMEIRLAAVWLDELDLVSAAHKAQLGAQVHDPIRHDVPSARQRVAQLFGRLAADGEWLQLRDLVAGVKIYEPMLLRDLRVDRWNHSLLSSLDGDIHYAGVQSGRRWSIPRDDESKTGWDLLQIPFILAVADALHHLGLLDMGLDEQGLLVAVRMTAMGRHLLAGDSIPVAEQEVESRVVVQPNFRIVALGPLDESIWLDLEQFADSVSADRAVELELSRDSLYRAQRAGISSSAVVEHLKALTGGPLPQNVARTLEEWQQSHEQIEIHFGVDLVQSAEPELLTELVDAVGGRIRPLSRTVAQVLDQSALEHALADVGVTPVSQESRSVTNGATLDDEGVIGFRQPSPSLYVLGQIQRLAEWRPERSSWQLTRSSTRRALRRYRMDGPAQTQAWQGLLAGSAPDWLEQRIKAWTGYFGAGRLHQPMLLELPDEQALEELIADPAVGKALRRFQPSGAQAIIDVEQLDDLRDLLAEYGIELENE